MSLTTTVTQDDVSDLEGRSNVRSFALDSAWAEAASESGYAKPLWIGLKENSSVVAAALGLKRRRWGVSKIVCGSNGGVGILSTGPDTAAKLLDAMQREWRPSILEVFASESILAPNFSWEPAYTFHVDLRGPLEEILSRFDKRTRNALKSALRNGITAQCASSSVELDQALALLCQTASAKGFSLPPRAYLSAIHSAFHRNGLSEVIVAMQGQNPVAVVHVIGAHGVASWWKGGATPAGYRLNASLVAHWRAIELAKERGFQTYDLGGTHPSDSSYANIHRFKSSLAGRLVVTSIGRRSTAFARAALGLRLH